MERRISPSTATMRAPEMAGRAMVKGTGGVTDLPGAGGGGVDGDVDGEADLAIDGHDAGAGNGGAVDGEGHGERHGFAGREAAQPGGGGLELDAGSGALQLQQRGGGAGRAFVPELEAHLDGLAGGRPRRANNLEARKRDTWGYPGGRADADFVGVAIDIEAQPAARVG